MEPSSIPNDSQLQSHTEATEVLKQLEDIKAIDVLFSLWTV